MGYIQHINLATGRAHRSGAPGGPPGSIAALRPLIARAAAGELVSIPTGDLVFAVTGWAVGRCIFLSAATENDGVSLPVCAIAIAPKSRCAGRAWDALLDVADQAGVDIITDRSSPPPAPWAGVVPLPGLAAYPEAGRWLSDLESRIAWAWCNSESEGRGA